ncbi:MAG: polysaccharide deacetylase family protein [Chloroflexi bacterium]|nr:polysaccharide deacetylase family protein [Chloroflexota bacterium]
MSTSCRARSTNTPTVSNTATIPSTATDLPPGTATPSATSTITPTATPDVTLPVSEILDGAKINCPTPMSLMLHTAYGPERMEELAQEIIDNRLQTLTYTDLLTYLLEGECPPENTIIVSLDDLGTNWLRPDFRHMIQVFVEHDLKMVVAVVTQGPQNTVIWDYLREIDAEGIEIASHTVNHFQLSALNDTAIEDQLHLSHDIICANMEKCPETIILPFGDGGDDPRVFSAGEGYYIFVIGIQGGLEFGGETPFFLGRIPPHNDDQALTIVLLQNTFGP